MANSSSLDTPSLPPEVQLFFREIKENPDDDTPRLVFADWLQEHGDVAAAARGEFLRLSVLRHRLSRDDPSYGLLKRREGELFRQYGWTWLGPFADAARSWTFERGMVQFVAQVEKILSAEVEAWSRTAAGLWVDVLTLLEVNPERATRLAGSPLLGRLTRLDLSYNRFHFRTALDSLFRAPFMPYLAELLLSGNRMTVGHVGCLAQRPHSSRLRLLDLRHNRLDDAAAILLAESPYLKDLRVLLLGHNRFTADGIVLLRRAFGERVSF
jgi:uncharacterized protein (TIGR02996 family)